MRRLNGFNKTNKKKNIVIISAFLIIGIILAGISYAVYQKEDEVLFINAKVGQFETSSSDIELAMKLDGEEVDVPPSKSDGYYNVTVECDYAIGRWDEEEWGAVITSISSNRVKCNVNFETLKIRPLSIVEVGDYIRMTPTSTSYTIPTSLTGYSSNQTINPSELNLWRVIKKNDDGTVEVVSEYVSSADVYLSGKTGYMNFVGALNTIAAQYTNDKYVSKTRHMGYSNQILKCTSITPSACPDDLGYETDVNLVQAVIEVLAAKKTNEIAANYWLASRRIVTNEYGSNYFCRRVNNEGTLENPNLYIVYSYGGDKSKEDKGTIRPILTLKSDIDIISGDGKSAETAYQFS